MVRFSKYKFYNKLLGDVILLKCYTIQYFLKLDTNFDKSIVGLHYLHIFLMFAKFQGNQRLIVMSLINCLNLSFCHLK